MRVPQQREAPLPEMNMTPMIDIVFQLVAFFMIAINFSGASQDERIRLPISELAQPSKGPFVSPIPIQ